MSWITFTPYASLCFFVWYQAFFYSVSPIDPATFLREEVNVVGRNKKYFSKSQGTNLLRL